MTPESVTNVFQCVTRRPCLGRDDLALLGHILWAGWLIVAWQHWCQFRWLSTLNLRDTTRLNDVFAKFPRYFTLVSLKLFEEKHNLPFKYKKTRISYIVNTVVVDGLAMLETRASATTVLANISRNILILIIITIITITITIIMIIISIIIIIIIMMVMMMMIMMIIIAIVIMTIITTTIW